MTQQEIINNNKLIAKFMGREVHTDGIGWFDEKFKSIQGYEKDWNLLMPVVEKIEELGSYYISGVKLFSDVKFSRNEVIIQFVSSKQDYLFNLHYCLNLRATYKHPMFKHHIIKKYDFKTKGLLSGLYDAIIEFINWYNENK